MTKFKGSKGNWTLGKTRNGHAVISGEDWEDFCKVYKITDKGFRYDEKYRIHEANAVLIAHAKDMFDLLELFVSENMLSHKGEELADKMIKSATTYPS